MKSLCKSDALLVEPRDVERVECALHYVWRASFFGLRAAGSQVARSRALPSTQSGAPGWNLTSASAFGGPRDMTSPRGRQAGRRGYPPHPTLANGVFTPRPAQSRSVRQSWSPWPLATVKAISESELKCRPACGLTELNRMSLRCRNRVQVHAAVRRIAALPGTWGIACGSPRTRCKAAHAHLRMCAPTPTSHKWWRWRGAAPRVQCR